MSQMRANPDEMKRFAAYLRNAAGQLREGRGALDSEYRTLGESWRDSRSQAFSKVYDQAMPAIERFCRQAEAYAAFLDRKAAAIDHYLGRR